jgi:hypothetical protein
MIEASPPINPIKKSPFRRLRGQHAMSNIRKFIVEVKRDKACLDCGIVYPPHVLDFDHVRGTKHRAVSSLVGRGSSLLVLATEIAKCDLVCSNCHRERTFQRRRNPTFKNQKKIAKRVFDPWCGCGQ